MTVTIERGIGRDCRPDGWDVFVDGEWANRFPTKRQATEASKAFRLAIARFDLALGNKASVGN